VVNLVGIGMADPPRVLVGCEGVRPAPALALAARVMAAGAPAGSEVGEPTGFDARPAAGARALAVALLVAGIALVVVGALVARRWMPDDPEGAGPVAEPAADPPPPSPQLTLVRVPNEHGP
jgi:hypothetical protein